MKNNFYVNGKVYLKLYTVRGHVHIWPCLPFPLSYSVSCTISKYSYIQRRINLPFLQQCLGLSAPSGATKMAQKFVWSSAAVSHPQHTQWSMWVTCLAGRESQWSPAHWGDSRPSRGWPNKREISTLSSISCNTFSYKIKHKHKNHWIKQSVVCITYSHIFLWKEIKGRQEKRVECVAKFMLSNVQWQLCYTQN